MSQVRVVSFDSLLTRLLAILGPESLLYQRFEFAFNHKDENAIDAAMQSLHMYPEPTREAVENAMLGWLFGHKDVLESANSNTVSNQIN